MKTTLEQTLKRKFNELLNNKIYISWRSFLNIQYEIASEKHLYEKCYQIQELIIQDINS